MSYRFIFSFMDPNEEPTRNPKTKKWIAPTEHHFGFYFTDEDAARRFGEKVQYEGLDQEIAEELEAEYGLHDGGCRPDTEISGYSSNEVPRERWDELLNKWRDWYVGQGLECGPIISVEYDE